MPCALSRTSFTFAGTIGLVKLGQPVPESNLSVESEQRLSRHYVDVDARLLVVVVLTVKGLSVPESWVIRRCSGSGGALLPVTSQTS